MSSTAYIADLKASSFVQSNWQDQLAAGLKLNSAVASIYAAAASDQVQDLRQELIVFGQNCQRASTTAESSSMETASQALQGLQRCISDAIEAFRAGPDGYTALSGRLRQAFRSSETVLKAVQDARNQYATVESSLSKLQQGKAAGHETVRKALEEAGQQLKAVLAWYDNVTALAQTLLGRTESLLKLNDGGLTEESGEKGTRIAMEASAVTKVISAACNNQGDFWQKCTQPAWYKVEELAVGGVGDIAELQNELRSYNESNGWSVSRGVSRTKDEALKYLDKVETALKRYE